MGPQEVLDIGREAVYVLIQVAFPILMIALVVGLIVALFQSLTSIQEMTLTFVPKIIAVFVGLIFLLPFMIDNLQVFAEHLMEKIVQMGVT